MVSHISTGSSGQRRFLSVWNSMFVRTPDLGRKLGSCVTDPAAGGVAHRNDFFSRAVQVRAPVLAIFRSVLQNSILPNKGLGPIRFVLKET